MTAHRQQTPRHQARGRSGSVLCRSLGALLLLGLAACSSPEEREADHFARGMELMAEGQTEKAIVEFRNVLELNPKNARAIYQLGLINERAGEPERAIETYLQATLEQPDFVPAHLKAGELGLILGDLQTARESAAAVERLAPEDPEGLALRGALALQAGNPEAALELARQALDQVPDLEPALALEVGALRALGQPGDAMARLEDALTRRPDSARLHLLRATLAEAEGDPATALEHYRRLAELEPDDEGHRLRLARYYIQQDQAGTAADVLREAMAAGFTGDQVVSLLLNTIMAADGKNAVVEELERLIDANPDQVDYRFRLASFQAQQGDLGAARAVLDGIRAEADREALEQRVDVAQAQLALLEGDQERAVELLAGVLQANPDHVDANLLRGRILLEEGDLDAAIVRLRTALRQNPENAAALRLLAQAHVQDGEPGLAITSLYDALEAAPEDQAVARMLGSLLTRRGDYDAALRIWDHLIRLNPRDPLALQGRAEIAMAQRKWSAARANIDWLRAEPGGEALAALLEGRLLALQGHYEESRAAFARALELAPDAAWATAELVQTYLGENDVEGAIGYLEQRLTEQPDHVPTLRLLAEVLFANERPEEAEEVLQRIVDLAPEQADSWRALATLERLNGNPEAAIAAYQKALEQAPDDPVLLGELAGLYAAEGRIDEALQTYERALPLAGPGHPLAHAYARLVAEHRADDAEALERALAAMDAFRTSNDPAHLDTLGWLHQRQGDPAAAATFLERVVAMAPDEPLYRYHLGMALLARGDHAQAREQLQQAVAPGAAYPGLEDARAALARLEEETPPATSDAGKS